MKKNVIWFTLMIIVLTFLVIGCGGRGADKPKEVIKPPPSAWDIAPTAYSDLIFNIGDKNNSPWVGLDGFPLGRWDAQWLGKEPGFNYYDGRQGGEGDTLEIVSAINGMDFKWAHQQLKRFDLFKGWKGQIIINRGQPTGICLGSPAADFLAKFPNAKSVGPGPDGYVLETPPDTRGYYTKGNYMVMTVGCDKDNRLDYVSGVLLWKP